MAIPTNFVHYHFRQTSAQNGCSL